MNQIMNSIRAFAQEEDGAQVVEYALIIALLSIILAVALSTGGLQAGFTALVTRVTNCFNSTNGSC